MTGTPQIQVSMMLRCDKLDVLKIDNASYDDPLSHDELHMICTRWHTTAMVAHLGSKTVGYMIYRLDGRYSYIERLAVHPRYRCMGAGTAMIDVVKSKSVQRKREAVIAHAYVMEMDICEWLSHLEFVVPDTPGMAVGDLLEFHWPCDEGARLLERFNIGDVRVQ